MLGLSASMGRLEENQVDSHTYGCTMLFIYTVKLSCLVPLNPGFGDPVPHSSPPDVALSNLLIGLVYGGGLILVFKKYTPCILIRTELRSIQKHTFFVP